MNKKFYLLYISFVFIFLQVFSFSSNASALPINPKESLLTEVLAKIQRGALYQSDNIKVSTVYPNPASAYTLIDYSLDVDVDAKIIITNAIGTKVAEFKLDAFYSNIRITTADYASGVYFYTLSIDGKRKASKKLFVKH